MGEGRFAGGAAALAGVLLAASAVALALASGSDPSRSGAGHTAAGMSMGAGTDTPSRMHMASTMGVGPPPVWDDGTPAVPTRHLGPQGQVGQFVAKCLYSHSAPADPIVWPGRPGRSHRHDFYGSTQTDALSTPAKLEHSDSTCDKAGDSAAYWQPTLYDHDAAVEPYQVNAYYRAAPGVKPTDVQPFPFGMALIAGDALATTPQAGEAAGWTCGVETNLTKEPTECAAGSPLHLVLTFPDCWDGTRLDSPNHRDHATYSRDGGKCPATHPVHVPQLTVSVKFPIYGPGHDLRLASGSTYSAHGDFFNAWDPVAMDREVRHCLHNNEVCGLASNREQVAPFFTE